VLNAIEYVTKQFNIYEDYNVDQYLTAYGLCINPEYRGRGIATEMLKAQVTILKAFSLTVTSTPFTAIGSQIAAKKAGFIDVFIMSYDDIEKTLPRFDFSKTVTEFFKTMAMSI
jgi:GNAT superfamily N-acetyltransferase